MTAVVFDVMDMLEKMSSKVWPEVELGVDVVVGLVARPDVRPDVRSLVLRWRAKAAKGSSDVDWWLGDDLSFGGGGLEAGAVGSGSNDNFGEQALFSFRMPSSYQYAERPRARECTA